MRTSVNWTNPYKAGGTFWLKGNLHTHTTNSDGKLTPEETVSLYLSKGYTFLAVTDHGKLFDPKTLRSKMLLIAGVEADFDHGKHTCITAVKTEDIKFSRETPQQELIDKNTDKTLVVLNHPDWGSEEHFTIDSLKSFKNYHGIEIYNSVIERLEGSPLSTAKWDRLLGNGLRLLGLANQDFHRADDFRDACNVVNVKKKTAAEVFKAVTSGNFYCYFGVKISSVGRKNNTVYVKTANAETIRFIGNYGVLLSKTNGKAASFDFDKTDATKYIRIECLGKGEEISWSQPFFREA